MINGLCRNASDVRKNWSMTIDSVVHERPAFITRTHDNIAMLNEVTLTELLRNYKFNIIIDKESDGSVTGFLEELQLVENAEDTTACIDKMIAAMRDYAMDYYNEFSYWSKAPNRSQHIPYVVKILISSDDMIKEDMICQNGKN